MHNNDILKSHIRSRKAEGYFAEITGTMIAKAGRDQLVDWITDLKEDPAEIIANHRRNEKAAPAATPTPAAAPVAAPAPSPAPASAEQVAKDLANLLANASGKDGELRAKVEKIEKDIADLQGNQVKNLVVKIADRPAVNVGKVHKSFEDLQIGRAHV